MGWLGTFDRGWLRALRAGSDRRRQEALWIEDIGRTIADLERMNRSSEAGFLAVGERLSGFLSAARVVSAKASSAAQRVSGEQGQRDSDALARVLGETERMRRSAGSAAGFSRLRDSAKRLRQVFAGFEQTVVSFQVLAVAARIETARLGAAGSNLGHLVEEMRAGGADIASRTDRFLAAAGSLGSRVEAELSRIADLDNRQLKMLGPLTGAVAADFAALRSRRELGETAGARLGAQFGGVAEAIGAVVRSVQFHDITRQQIEHVMQALRQVHEKAGQGRRAALGAEDRAILALQVAQLENAGRMFLKSVVEIDRQLETVGRRVNEMAAEGENLTGIGQGQAETFFADMAARFSDILNVARECESYETGARGALAELRETIRALEGALADIQAIELQLKRVSLNSAIQAVHLGRAGEPFSAVALAMHGLQSECEDRSAHSRAEVDSMGAAMQAAGGSRQVSEEQAGMERAVDDLRQRMEEMHAADASGMASRREMGRLAGQLSLDIEVARRDLADSRGFTEAVNACRERLQRLAGKNAGALNPDLAPAGRLDEYTRNYTMRSEHEVHQELMGNGAAVSDTTGAGVASGELELF